MARRALYYPEVRITDPAFLFEALLYWDRLACIAPRQDFDLHEPYHDTELSQEMGRLIEGYVTAYVPSSEQKEAVHRRLAPLFSRTPPPWATPEHLVGRDAAFLYPGKVSEDTLRLLTDCGWLDVSQGADHGVIASGAANVILAALADECSSATLRPITRDLTSFRASCNTLLFELGSRDGLASDVLAEADSGGEDGDDVTFMVASVPHLAVRDRDLTPQTLRLLGELREDPGFDEQRTAYGEKLDEYLGQLSGAPPGERVMIAQDWEQSLDKDRKALKRELRSANIDGIFDQQGVIALVASGGLVSAGAVVGGVIGGPIGIAIGLTIASGQSWFARRKRRREVLGQHWTSWLHTLETKLPA